MVWSYLVIWFARHTNSGELERDSYEIFVCCPDCPQDDQVSKVAHAKLSFKSKLKFNVSC